MKDTPKFNNNVFDHSKEDIGAASGISSEHFRELISRVRDVIDNTSSKSEAMEAIMNGVTRKELVVLFHTQLLQAAELTRLLMDSQDFIKEMINEEPEAKTTSVFFSGKPYEA